MTKIAAAGDARRTMALLWGAPSRPAGSRPGPKGSLSVDGIVEAAIALADERADASVSLRAVAARLGCTPMALYTHVADRRELLDLMYDRVHATLDAPVGEGWRERTTAWAHAMAELYLRHPWVVEVSFARSVLGPHEQRALELLLEALAPAGLGPADTAAVVAALFGLARSTASTLADARRAASVSDERAWWTARQAALAEVAPDFAARFPFSVPATGGRGDAAEAPSASDGWSAPGQDDRPWLERAARDAFGRAVAMLLEGAAASVADVAT